MNAEEYAEAKQLFLRWLDAGPGDRDQILDAVEPGLRSEVEALLAAHRDDTTRLERVPGAALASLAADAMVGERIGPYRVLGVLGEGGIGTVLLAERADVDFEQRVAIKLVKRGMDSDAILARFRSERRILAQLEHEHIARLIDGGVTEAGRPYLVMEHVEGAPIDRWCDQHALGIAARVAMVRTVCAAVDAAHRALIVHRDLKPSNVLVGAGGIPKLLDFGIAKLLTDDAEEHTRTGERILTPAYASPEQLRGELVTTASDVYSLGVVLYELLCGTRPERVPPPPPSAAVSDDGARRRGTSVGRLRRQLAGDLDTIVLRALHPEPQRRYASALQLAEDLGRYLDGEPVAARRDSWGYRAGKFVVRHKVAVAASVLAAVALIAGTVATAWQARVADQQRARAEDQRARAERRFGELRALANTFVIDVHDAIRELPGATAARKKVVEQGLRYLDSLARDAIHDPGVQHDLANAYRAVGDVLGNPAAANLGDSAGALAAYRKALILDQLAGTQLPQARLDAALTVDRIADVHWDQGDYDRSLAGHREALARFESLAADPATFPGAASRVAGMLGDIGDDHLARQDLDAARPAFDDAIAHLRAQLAAGSTEPVVRRNLAVFLIKSGDLRMRGGDLDGAEAFFSEALAMREQLYAEQPDNAGSRREVSASITRLSGVARKRDDYARARSLLLIALDHDMAATARDPMDARARRDLAVTLTKLFELHHNWADVEPERRVAHLKQARSALDEALEQYGKLADAGQVRAGDATVVEQLQTLKATLDPSRIIDSR